MKKKVIKLTESDLKNIVLKVVQEQGEEQANEYLMLGMNPDDKGNGDKSVVTDLKIDEASLSKALVENGELVAALLKSESGKYIVMSVDNNGNPLVIARQE
jgi:hypothetical protein